ncbi:MAG: hypothetical protein UR69_C0002G0131 [Candidatus Moranbacteria bacterium GW2011_GWE2_35_2-]|nr:MAG: hypothetical protein UR69_C0002G0131 [Candidatus Moranbacteria bacterium GW2011_GWE2_35_2-]KKQ22519.1 MAG: hypothetical protein US37_C0002G0144 [Candidatus Moranbacteria bacterium GW2011_GWF2_37_11]KKQ29588.1 MAG: hypothetical protein US44_C0001G0180 [Candidatus Moranbacteria bacterium GW2011_GWD1_37_17]KKQ30541.1 MAG: hypothetical protein US47_C0002G0131 [Candidatus Moranbacteria bacterium GW2011_GWE1_37_24]HBO17213.1 hypothetical protein [Candidatus Moranbacteria bacterium]
MLEIFLSIIDYIFKLAISFSDSGFFMVAKFILAIYILVLFVDIVLLLFFRGLGKDLRKMLRGADLPPLVKSKFELQWNKIRDRLKSKNQSQYKAAVLEADSIADEMLKKIGYLGKDMSERLESANIGQIENLEELKKSHQVRNRIVYEKDFSLDLDSAKEVIKSYEEFLKFIDIL